MNATPQERRPKSSITLTIYVPAPPRQLDGDTVYWVLDCIPDVGIEVAAVKPTLSARPSAATPTQYPSVE